LKIGLQTWGSDGDIRPFLALAGGLRARGHEVTLVVTSVDRKDYSSFGRKMGYSVVHAGKLSYSDEEMCRFARKVLGARHVLSQLNIILKTGFDPVIAEMYDAAEELSRKNDIIIGHFIHYPAHAAAEKAGKPYLTVTLNHSGIYSRHSRVNGAPELGKWLCPASWKFAGFLMDVTLGKDINKFRKKIGLPPVKNIMKTVLASHRLNLVAESAVIGARQPDWPDYHQVCGVFSMPDSAEDWIMPADLRKFIESGPPPIFMTIGSMLMLDPSPSRITSLLVRAALIAGCRASVQSRWDEIADIPDHPDIYRIRSAPHQHLFPLCTTVVHHGGAGTTHSSLLHGCPSVVIEHFADQAFFAGELYRLGVAPKALHRRSITVHKLADAIRTVLANPEMKRRAGELGAIMQKENGVGNAVELIEERCSAAGFA
jgi:UDP:flavonoid glycosyltransferase YjiC (YdhE family)